MVGFVAPRRMQVRFDVCAPINQLLEAPVFSRLRGSVNGWAKSAGDLRRAIASYADKLHTILYRAHSLSAAYARLDPIPLRCRSRLGLDFNAAL